MKLTFSTVSALSLALVMLATASPQGRASQGHSAHADPHALHPSQVAALRGATARFHQLSTAIAEGYTAFGGCFSSPSGAMGYHYVNGALVDDPAIDPLRPELLAYERLPNGKMQLVAVEWITFAAAWHARHADAPSQFGATFHSNDTLLAEPFYLQHAWIWKHNPSGMLADWNPKVHCH